MEKYGDCVWEITDSIGILKIDNPPQNKIINPEFVDIKKFNQWTLDKNLRGLIITGTGRHFSGGADIEILMNQSKNQELMQEKIKAGTDLLKQIEFINIPVIAAISGACFGGGLEIALACHIRVCSPNTMISFPESELNLMPGLNGTIRLPKLIGTAKALKLILSGDIINAEDALKLNIIDYISYNEDVFDYSFKLIKHMTDNKKTAVINSIVRSLNNSKRLSFDKAMEEEMKMFCSLAFDEANRIAGQEN